MLNLVVPITTQNWGIGEVLNAVSVSNFKEEIIVRFLCAKNNPKFSEISNLKTKNISASLDVFPANATEDEMVYSFLKNTENLAFVLVRSTCNFFCAEKLDSLIAADADIALFNNQKQNKIKTFVKEKAIKLCKNFFNINFFDGNISCMFFSSRAHKIMQETNVTALTKINRWVCVDIQTVDADILPRKPIKTPLNIKALTFLWLFVMFASVFFTIFLAVSGKLTLLKVFLLLGGFLLGAALSVHSGLRWFCYRQLGGLYCKTKMPIERRKL